MEYTGLYNQNFRLWLESKEYIYGMVDPRKMHHFEPDLDDDQRSLDRIKTDELDAFRIAIYCGAEPQEDSSQSLQTSLTCLFEVEETAGRA